MDGNATQTVDLYRSNWPEQVTVFSAANLPNTQHTLRIAWSGTKNPLATDTYVDVDAFTVSGDLVPDTAPPTTTADVRASYLGTATVHLTASDTQSGVATTRYRLDGGTWTTGASVSVPGLGTHRLDYCSTDYSGNIEVTQTATFDVLARIDDTSGQISYSGYWGTNADSKAYSGGYHTSRVSGSSLSVTFQGPRIDWVAPLGPCYGIAAVSIDGSASVPVDLYRSTWPEQVTVYSFTGLSDTVHTLTIAWTGSRNALATDSYVCADAFDVAETLSIDSQAPVTTSNVIASYPQSATISLTAADAMSGVASTKYRLDGNSWVNGTSIYCSTLGHHTLAYYSTDNAGNKEATKTASFDIVTRLDDTDPAVSFMGSWQLNTDTKAWRGAYRASRIATAEVDVVFTGSRIDWISPMGPCYGIAAVSVDGGEPQMVDLYKASWPTQAVAFTTQNLNLGAHTLRIVRTGTKNASASDTYVAADAFDVFQ